MSCLAASNVSVCEGPRLLISATMHLQTKPKPTTTSYLISFWFTYILAERLKTKRRPTWWWRGGSGRRGGEREHRRPERVRARGGGAPGFRPAAPCTALWTQNRPNRTAPLSGASFASSTSFPSLLHSLSILVLWNWGGIGVATGDGVVEAVEGLRVCLRNGYELEVFSHIGNWDCYLQSCFYCDESFANNIQYQFP